MKRLGSSLMDVSLSSITKFEPYVETLEELAARRDLFDGEGESDARVSAALDGQPRDELRKLVPLAGRKTFGAFFTARLLADAAVAPWTVSLSQHARILDPACGAGDLLLAAARLLPLDGSLEATLSAWGERLYGFDLHPEFVRATKARLCLLACQLLKRSEHRRRRGTPRTMAMHDVFPNIRVADGLHPASMAVSPTHIVVNPPFQKMVAPDDFHLGGGLVSNAAVFLHGWISTVPSGVEIVAILPDVLRAGSNYARWRGWIESTTTMRSLQVYGAFDSSAGVDVFVLRLTSGKEKRARSLSWWNEAPHEGERVADRFDVRVGSVVPHRDPQLGPSCAFINSGVLAHWGTLPSHEAERRRYGGPTFMPPFVAVRRTSAPGDRKRAIGTVVTGREPVAVENHLLVLTPRDGSLRSCRKLLQTLRSDSTDAWLNNRIRCRHLTVSAFAELPLWGES